MKDNHVEKIGLLSNGRICKTMKKASVKASEKCIIVNVYSGRKNL